MSSAFQPDSDKRHQSTITTYTYDAFARPVESSRPIDQPIPTQPLVADVTVEDMDAWVRVYSKRGMVYGDLPVELSHSLNRWIRERPYLQVQTIVPMSINGRTVELHAWYLPTSPDDAYLVKPNGSRE